MDVLRTLDDSTLRDLNSLARDTSWLHAPVLAYATYGLVLFGALLVAGLWWARARESRTLAAAAWAPLGMLVALALNQVVAGAVGEQRPYDRLPDLLVLAQRTTDVSFPSDHAVMAGAVAAGLWLVNRRLGQVASVAAVVMAAARVYIAAHYPWDVVAGLAFGALVSLGGWWALSGLLIRVTTRVRNREVLARVFREPVAPSTP